MDRKDRRKPDGLSKNTVFSGKEIVRIQFDFEYISTKIGRRQQSWVLKLKKVKQDFFLCLLSMLVATSWPIIKH